MRALVWVVAAFVSVCPGVAQSGIVQEANKPVEIRFAGVLGHKPFACGERYTIGGEDPVNVTPADLRFYVSNVELLDAAGKATPIALDQDGIWQYRNVALVDLEDGKGGCRNGNPAMHAVLSGSAPAGSYTGIRFTVGVPFELGHLDPTVAPAPLNFTAMSWVWQTGLKFIRAEFLVENVAKVQSELPGPNTTQDAKSAVSMSPVANHMRTTGFPIHIGSTGCVSASKTSAPEAECAHPNRAIVVLNGFDPERDTVVFDLDRLLSGSDLTLNAPNTAPGCMSGTNDPDCALLFHALGLSFGGAEAVEQTVFRKEMP